MITKRSRYRVVVAVLFLVQNNFGQSRLLQEGIRNLSDLSVAAVMWPFWNESYAYWFNIDGQGNDCECNQNECDVPCYVVNFVRTVLKERGILDAEKISIKYECFSEDPVDGEYSQKTIYISSLLSYVEISNKKRNCVVTENGEIKYLNQNDCPDDVLKQKDVFWDVVMHHTGMFFNLTDAIRLKKRLEKEVEEHKHDNRLVLTLEHMNDNLDEHKAVIQHEAGHHYYKIMHKMMFANFLVPIVNYSGISVGMRMIRKNMLPQSLSKNNIMKGLIPGAVVFLTYLTSKSFVSWYSRYHEFLADGFVENDPRILKAYKRVLQRIQEYDGNYECEECSCCSQTAPKGYLLRLKETFFESNFGKWLFNGYPDISDRIRRLDERLDRLSRF